MFVDPGGGAGVQPSLPGTERNVPGNRWRVPFDTEIVNLIKVLVLKDAKSLCVEDADHSGARCGDST